MEQNWDQTDALVSGFGGCAAAAVTLWVMRGTDGPWGGAERGSADSAPQFDAAPKSFGCCSRQRSSVRGGFLEHTTLFWRMTQQGGRVQDGKLLLSSVI